LGRFMQKIYPKNFFSMSTEIQPFKAWRYNDYLTAQLPQITAPLTETLAQQRKAIFYQQPYHYYHISSPLDTPPYTNAQRRVDNWKTDKVIELDELPAFYVYAQYFSLKENPEKIYTRKGFIAHLRTSDFDEKIVLPHELTIEKAVNYRIELLKNTQMHTIPTHGFYTDKNQVLEKYWDESLKNPIYEVVDEFGTKHVVARIQDYAIMQSFAKNLADKQIWIADGHHRYQSSFEYAKQKNEMSKRHYAGYNYHLMWLTNTESSDLGLLPTHRLVHSLEDFSEENFLKQLEMDFIITETDFSPDKTLAPTENLWTFVLVFKERNFLLRLKKDNFATFDAPIPEAVKRLDVSVMHHFILEKCLGLSEQKQFEHLDFSPYLGRCYEEVKQGNAHFALITRKVTLEEIESVIYSGYTMPAKTTYFFPKVLGGLVFSDADNQPADFLE
jgi:uncharacterized protein (DUF1015 family)